MPCDQAEQDRLAIQHQVFIHALKGKLTTTPVTGATTRVLDLGTGPGNWAVDFAKQYPHVDVVGVDMAVWDLETTEAGFSSDKLTWEIDDLDLWGTENDVDDLTSRLGEYDPFHDPTHRNPTEPAAKPKTRDPHDSQTPFSETSSTYNPYVLEPEPEPGWNFSKPFDLIHVRNMKGSFAYWEDVYAEIYKNLAPGGWVEVTDFELVVPEIFSSQSMPGEPTNESPKAKEPEYPFPTSRKLFVSMMEASFKAGRPLGTFYMHPTYLEDAGFKDVKTTYVNVPVGQWPEDEEQQRIGKMTLVVLMEVFEPNLLRLLTTHGDAEKIWTAEEVREYIERGKNEILTYNEYVTHEKRKDGWCARFKWLVGRKSKNA
jgi:SAM-dependent methyltransferase